ncbi:hypothetical protein BDF22DRAFT_656711 [Syncephalis plumigaleata]|nr:hypothetical protein BDF22DRAFT_656711 [Syncephalis plumigaleata]
MDLHRTSFPLSSVVRSNVEKRGWLFKWSTSGLRRGWKKRYVVLKGNHMFFFKNLKDEEPVASVVNLDEYRNVWQDTNCKKSRHSFRVTPITPAADTNKLSVITGRNKELQLFAENADEMRAWMQIIQRKLPRSEGNILDSVLRRLDYNKYSRPRSSTDLRSHSSCDSMNSSNDAPSLSGTGSSGEETPNGSLTSGTPVGSPIAMASTMDLPVKPMSAMERRRMRRSTLAAGVENKLSRRRSSPLLPGGSQRRALRLNLDHMPMPTFDCATPSMVTPTFGVTSPIPASPSAVDFDSYVLSLHTTTTDLPSVDERISSDALSRMEFM